MQTPAIYLLPLPDASSEYKSVQGPSCLANEPGVEKHTECYDNQGHDEGQMNPDVPEHAGDATTDAEKKIMDTSNLD